MLAVLVIDNPLCLRNVNEIKSVFNLIVDRVERIDEITGYIVLCPENFETEYISYMIKHTKKSAYFMCTTFLGSVYTNNTYLIIDL